MKAWQERDCNVMVAVANKHSDHALEENPKLLMRYATRREQKQEVNIRKTEGMLKQKCLKHRNTHKSFVDICERLKPPRRQECRDLMVPA